MIYLDRINSGNIHLYTFFDFVIPKFSCTKENTMKALFYYTLNKYQPLSKKLI